MRLANAHNPRKHTQPSSSVSPLSSTTTLPSPPATASTAASSPSTSTTTTIDPLWQLQHIHVEFYTALAALSAATSMMMIPVAAAASSKKQQKKKRNKRRMSGEDDSPQSSSTVSLDEYRPPDQQEEDEEEENERVRLRRSFYSLSSHYGRHALRRCREARHGFHVPVPRLAAGGGGAAALRSSRGVLSTSIAHRYLCRQCGCFCRQTVDHRLLRPFTSLDDGSLKKQKKRTKTKTSPLSAVPKDVTQEIFTTTATTTDETMKKDGEDDDDDASSRLTWTIRRAALHCPRCCHRPEEARREPGGNQEELITGVVRTVAPLPSTSSLRLAKPCRRKRCRSSSSSASLSSTPPSAHRPSHLRLGPTTTTSIKTTHVVNLRTSSSEPKPASLSSVATANLGAEASQFHTLSPPPASKDKGVSKNTPKSSSPPPAVTTAAIQRNEVPVPAAAAARPSSAAVKKTNHPPPPPPTAPAGSKRKVPPSSSFMNSLSNLGL